ncbi:SAM-dependent methyltransferase [Kribbella sp. GL6]|uniref:SAM-dependent methyltransferase n=1 Tax=Kribbella sp. GL6 TaxID=3419765 RepID=UPI003D0487A1
MGSKNDDMGGRETPSLARVWDALSGGKDNFAADRLLAEQLEKVGHFSELVAANADFRRRTLQWLAGPGKIAQFLMCGPGLPNSASASTVVHQIGLQARVLYVDNDPMVLTHTRALLETDRRVQVLDADIFDPKTVLNDQVTKSFLDWSEPIALIHTATLPHCPDDSGPLEVLRGYVDALPLGSYTVISHFAVPDQPSLAEMAHSAERILVDGPIGTGWFRSYDEIATYFPDQELLEPGLVPCDDWRPDDPDLSEGAASIRRCIIGGVGRVLGR